MTDIDSPLQTGKRVVPVCGWMKIVVGFHRSRYIGVERTEPYRELVAMAYNYGGTGSQ